MVKLYLDTCAIQRPLDALNQTRLRLEAEVILSVLAQIEAGQIELIASTILEMEIHRNPLAIRREHGEQILRQAGGVVIVDENIERQAIAFVRKGVKAMDALHLAAAEAVGVDYFCTCDDHFLRKAKTITSLRAKVVSPLELIGVIEQ